MLALLGIESQQAEEMVGELAAAKWANQLWMANYNSPGQLVLSGTLPALEEAAAYAKARGAKRAVPLNVHGAFHSGLMKSAQERLAPYLQTVSLKKGICPIACNVSAQLESDPQRLRQLLHSQMVSPVRWEQSIKIVDALGVSLYLELGCGATLSGLNKRIGVSGSSYSLEKLRDLEELAQFLES
jgi:[acyl-carrier-protein] S-malonyltransferase